MITSPLSITLDPLTIHDQLTINYLATKDSSLIANVWPMTKGQLLMTGGQLLMASGALK